MSNIKSRKLNFFPQCWKFHENRVRKELTKKNFNYSPGNENLNLFLYGSK